MFERLKNWFRGEPVTAETERTPPHKTNIVPSPAGAGRGERIESVHYDETIAENPPGDPNVCISTDCDNEADGKFIIRYRRGKLPLCKYHAAHPERIHFPKPEEAGR